ncbi:MAG: hypothetical protein ACYDEX_22015 [Mobilitalea sp.]
MYFWKIQLLKKQLIEQGLSEKHLFYYILIFVALAVLGTEIMGYLPYKAPNAWDYFLSFMNIAIPIIGTIFAYHFNGGGSGVKFAERYFSIGLVITIRFLVLLIPIMVVLMVYWFQMYDVQKEIPMSFPEAVLYCIWYAALYGYITKHIRQVAKA